MKSNKKRLEQLENLLNTECPKHENKCNSCPFQKECNEYERIINLEEK